MSLLIWPGVVLIGGAGSVLRFLVDGMISMEGATLEGFEPVGYLAPQDLEVETVSEHAWDGDRVRVLQERCEVTMRIRPDFTDPLVHRLLGQLQ